MRNKISPEYSIEIKLKNKSKYDIIQIFKITVSADADLRHS